MRRARVLRDQGKATFGSNFHTEMGYNWRLPELAAVLGTYQLRRVNDFIATRRRIAKQYDSELEGLDWLQPMKVPSGSEPNYYKYVGILSPNVSRARLKSDLKTRFGIPLSGEVYETPCHKQPVFQSLVNGQSVALPVAEDLCSRHICLPIFSDMTDEEQDAVIEGLRKVNI
jgi:dTDP-4-amino-4,6-dideoxygalactose transaminase